jgi:hypothetical protein
MPEHLTDVVTLVIVALVMSWFLPIKGAPYRLAGSRDAVRSIRSRRRMRSHAVRTELRGVRIGTRVVHGARKLRRPSPDRQLIDASLQALESDRHVEPRVGRNS